jgi:unsaturated chondroitin disaccharide hydrolase
MNIKNLLGIVIAAAVLSPVAVNAQRKQNFTPKPEILKLIDKNLADADKQYKVLMHHVPADSLPETFNHDGTWKTQANKGWTAGFYPGTLFYLYADLKDKALYDEGVRRLKVMEPMKTIDSHDIGFMMYDSYGVANRVAPVADYKQVLITSAQSLAKRFNPVVGCTMSWGSQPGHFRVIIDNMMNLELLMWATKATGDSTYAKVAISHANTTMKNHFRPDYSSYHLVDYNPATGEVIKKMTVQGAADESAWARGQGWGLYGFTMMYRETGDKRYLEQAKHIANFILSNPTLPADKVPYWDYSAPGIPNALRDVSAAAIYASALIELSRYDAANAKRYIGVAETIIKTLSTPTYKAVNGDNGGYLLKHSVGHFPKGALIDVPLTYADYYFVEAMLRYKNLDKNINR